ncbi:hypothetical protein LCGC14_2039750 [marine sediment metagenome]|uniref:Uncharacterized protein n=1 Tax=marine sediment metagenome TaxID=412755 RepID=A0A0F9H5P1_9ZZZZ
MSQQVLIIAQGLEIGQASKSHIASMRVCVEQFIKDPRVKVIYGITRRSTGFAAVCDVPNWQEADRLAAMAQVCGLTNIEMLPLVPPEQLRAGLEEAERIADAVPRDSPAYAQV